MRKRSLLFLLAMLVAALPLTAQAAEKGETKCDMKFDLKGWSAFFEEATGHGTVTCDNGQTAKVWLKVQGGGISFGKYNVINGKGEFSPVPSIDKIFGDYAAGTAEAGAVGSASASVYTKGDVSLALAGTGQGVEIGIDFGKLEIRHAHRMH
jgi:hypothetical protein